MALSMLYNGAANATMDSISNTLGLSGIPVDQLNAVNKVLIAQIPIEDPKVSLSIANSLWYDQNQPRPLTGFLGIINSDYNGAAQPLDFANPASVGQVNSWVASHTDNKITSMLNGFTPGEELVLINALYFDGAWQYAFDSNNTRNGAFYLNNGNAVDVPFMSLEQNLRIVQDPAYTLIELPFGGGKNFNMDIVLPANDQESLAGFAASFNRTVLAYALSRLNSRNIGLFLPKWQSSYRIPDMRPNLAELGMGIAMGKSADFTRIYTASAYLTQAIHETYIKVSETGTQATGSTSIGLSPTEITGPEIPAIRVNHPFFYLISEKQTGDILFIGTVSDPSKN